MLRFLDSCDQLGALRRAETGLRVAVLQRFERLLHAIELFFDDLQLVRLGVRQMAVQLRGDDEGAHAQAPGESDALRVPGHALQLLQTDEKDDERHEREQNDRSLQSLANRPGFQRTPQRHVVTSHHAGEAPCSPGRP